MKKTKIKKEIKTNKKDWKKMLIDFEEKLNGYFGEKAPQLPEKVRKVLVKINPYLILISTLAAIPGLLVMLGLGPFFSFLGIFGSVPGFQFSLATVFSLIVWIMGIAALPGLFKNKLSAWRLMFYTTLINAIYALINFSLGSLIIGTAISWYFWFQIKKYYK